MMLTKPLEVVGAGPHLGFARMRFRVFDVEVYAAELVVLVQHETHVQARCG
jgi:hypothetical protein